MEEDIRYIIKNDPSISVFRVQITRTIEGFEGYSAEIRSITTQAKQFSEKEIEVAAISRDNFRIILYLAINCKAFLQSLDYEAPLSIKQLTQLQELFTF